MVRPKKQIPPARKIKVTIRLSETEYETLKYDAKRARRSFADYARALLFEHRPIVHNEFVYDCSDMLKVFRNLGNITGSLNQIAKQLNQRKALTEKDKKIISDCIAEIMKMRNEVKKEIGEYRGNCETH